MNPINLHVKFYVCAHFFGKGAITVLSKRSVSPKMLISDTDKILVRHLPLAYTALFDPYTHCSKSES